MRERTNSGRRARASLLKACLRCQGDLFWREDLSGASELHCLQCSRVFQPEQVLTQERIA